MLRREATGRCITWETQIVFGITKVPGHKELVKIAQGDKYKYLPFIAFEVIYSEKEKALRGSLVTLQLTNASASILVLMGESAKLKSYLRKLVGRYSFVRYRIWSEKDVEDLYQKVIKPSQSLDKPTRNTFHGSS